MQILEGLFDHCVVQRNRRNVSEAAFSGACEGTGVVSATVRRNGRALAGFSGVKAGKAAKGRFAGCLKGLPAGGPYDVELAVGAETVAVKDVLVGDVWVVGGQSNAQGCGLLKDGPKPQPLVRAFYMNDRWGVAKESIHNMWAAVDQVHKDLCGGQLGPENTITGVGPGVGFGQKMLELTGVPQGLLACGHGGTSMSQWDPALKNLGTKSLYGATLRRFKKNGSKIAGVVWYQGESDANTQAAPLYTDRMKGLIKAFRRDMKAPELPIAVVQISRVVGWGPESVGPWNSVQDQERRLPQVVRNCTVVPAIDLSLDDCIHISGRDNVRLGHRLARAMHALRAGRKAGKPPIALGRVTMDEDRGLGRLTVEFDNVEGQLQSGGRPVGFSIMGPNSGSFIFDTVIEGNRAVIRSTQPTDVLSSLQLHYGYGADPICNITDAADRAVPVFGPVAIGEPRAVTGFIRDLRVSEFQPSAGKLQKLDCPRDLGRLGLKPRSFATNFCDLHLETGPRAPEDLLLYFVCAYECPETMRLQAMMGYDGPVKVWVDGRKLYHDPEGTNPAAPTDLTLPISGAKGKHEMIVALGTNNGRAWGVFLRFERLGVSKRLLAKGPEAYAMPKIIG